MRNRLGKTWEGKKAKMKMLIIILLICAAVGIIFGVDTYNKNRYCNPTLVAENFAMFYLIEDPNLMKEWSYKNIHKRIDELNYIPIGGSSAWWNSDGLRLLSWSRLGETVVATYGYHDRRHDGELSEILLYTVVLQQKDNPSLWEKLRDFIRRSPSLHKRRWLVVDFFSNSHIFQYLDKLESYLAKRPVDFSVPDQEILKKWEQEIWRVAQEEVEFETKWSALQKMRQHTKTDILYKQYLAYLKHIGANKQWWKMD